MSMIMERVEEAAQAESRPHVWVLAGVTPLEEDQATAIASGADPASFIGPTEWQGPMCFVCEQPFPADTPCPGE